MNAIENRIGSLGNLGRGVRRWRNVESHTVRGSSTLRGSRRSRVLRTQALKQERSCFRARARTSVRYPVGSTRFRGMIQRASGGGNIASTAFPRRGRTYQSSSETWWHHGPRRRGWPVLCSGGATRQIVTKTTVSKNPVQVKFARVPFAISVSCAPVGEST